MKQLTKSLKFAVIALGALAGTVAEERSSSALEPVDNYTPYSGLSTHMNVTSYACQTYNCSWASVESIGFSGDVDYAVVSCGFLQLKLQDIEIEFTGSAGDLDIEVYQFDATYVGGSYGIGDSETVYTSSTGANTLVLKIYGYNNATNTYTVWAHCG